MDFHRALIIDQYGNKPSLQSVKTPGLEQGDLLIQVEASTINPSDLAFLRGSYFKRKLPAVCGMEGTGKVIEAKGQSYQHWIGKRVCFCSLKYGSWAEYSITTPAFCFEITNDVPLNSAASGIINPLTAIAFVKEFRKNGGKRGIINTAAASSLGRMLNKYCKIEKIPLLNVVAREEQAEVLREEGAKLVLITQGNWQAKYQGLQEEYRFDFLYDCLGGGPITETLISNLPLPAKVYIYGGLEQKPLQLTNISLLMGGLNITGFMVFSWWMSADQQTQEQIRQNYSKLLISELSTSTSKQIALDKICEGLDFKAKKAGQGKILIKIK